MLKVKSSPGMSAVGPVVLAVIFLLLSQGGGQAASSSIPTFDYKIVNSYPHDKAAFTQGLDYEAGDLYEGTGQYGQSSLRRVDMVTGRVMAQANLSGELFGEGVTICKGRLIQLTWQSGIGLVYDKGNMTQIGNFSYPTEGWGITCDGSRLIMSDGTETLHFLDPDTFEDLGKIVVQFEGNPVKGLNELEYVNGNIFANIWPTSWIAIISPETGDVVGRIDLRSLQNELPQEAGEKRDVLNGIAFDAQKDRLFVTGKWWPKLFEIELLPRAGAEDR